MQIESFLLFLISCNTLLISQQANQLSGVLLQLLSRAKSTHVCKAEDANWLNFLDHAVNHNLEQIKNLTKDEQT